uniref:Uncharacterized protein n=1 Tax=Arundo donax TaxID=35708 RepID=A0A0A9BLV5_ARUDO
MIAPRIFAVKTDKLLLHGLNWTFKRFMTATISSTEVEDLTRDFPLCYYLLTANSYEGLF